MGVEIGHLTSIQSKPNFNITYFCILSLSSETRSDDFFEAPNPENHNQISFSFSEEYHEQYNDSILTYLFIIILNALS